MTQSELSHKQIVRRWETIQLNKKKYLRLTVLLLIICFVISLCFRTVVPAFIPKTTAVNLFTALRLTVSQMLGTQYSLDRAEIIRAASYYGESVIRLKISLFTLFAGMGLALAGAVFQQVYHNPIASPSTIGATSGVNLGNMVTVVLFTSSALSMVLFRYVICLVLTGAIMLVVLLVGRYLGHHGNTCSVLEMLMFGSILSRLISSFISYYMYHMAGTAFIAYQQLNLGIYQIYNNKSMLIFFIVIFGSLIPLLKMRFRINAVSMDPMEAQSVGVRIGAEQFISQMLASALIGAACIQCGDVGLFALVIPHIVRYMTGSDFRKLAVYSTLFGGIFLLLIRIVSSMIFLGDEAIPLNFIVSIVMIPVFLVILARRKTGFD